MKQAAFFFFQSLQSQDLRFGVNGNIGTSKVVCLPEIFGYEYLNRFSSSVNANFDKIMLSEYVKNLERGKD